MRCGAVAVVGLMVAAGAGQAQQVQAKDPQIPVQIQKNAVPPTVQQQQNKAIVILNGIETSLNGCPGALHASQQTTGVATVWTIALEDPSVSAARPHGLGIHIDFQGRKTPVKALKLRVDYLPLGLERMEIAPAITNTVAIEPRERSKTFDLDREAAMRIDANLLVGPAATVTRVHLVSATFADGSVWRAPTGDACTVVPSRFMPVAAR